jgi:opacity protein-like surface antigen
MGDGRWALMGLAVFLTLAPAWGWAEDTGKGNQVSFRGGFAGLTSGRGCEVFTDVYTCGNNANSGYYIGAALDLLLSKDLWGMMNGVSALGEIGVEFKRFDSNTTIVAASALTAVGPQNQVQVTMLTVDVAPKLKFMEGSAFRPWIIPIGLDFHVISPPSNQTNYLDIGIQFGAGVEYQVWKEFKVGLDGRFHLAANQTNTVNNFGTIGPYIGIGF